MKKLIVLLLQVICYHPCFSQEFFTACCDDTVCGNVSFPLSVTYDNIYPSQTVGFFVDDSYSQVIDLGFNFEFFGNTYTQCVVSTNSLLSFNTEYAEEYSLWEITEPAPSPLHSLNAIFGPWHDTDPSVLYQPFLSNATIGSAPDRKFIYTLCEVPLYMCNDSLATSQIILFETSNKIEIHIGKKPVCLEWNGGYAIEGLQNSDGTIGVIVPDRNYPSVWSAKNDGIRFSPDGVGSYTIEQIDYSPLNYWVDTIEWQDENGIIIGYGNPIFDSVVISTFYIARAITQCGSFYDTVNITLDTCFATGISNNSMVQFIPSGAEATMLNITGAIEFVVSYDQLEKAKLFLRPGIYIQVIKKENFVYDRKKILILK